MEYENVRLTKNACKILREIKKNYGLKSYSQVIEKLASDILAASLKQASTFTMWDNVVEP